MVAAILLAGSVGCVTQEEHARALDEIQRLRAEATQRSREAASLREAIDRMNVEGSVRPPASLAFMRQYVELASAFARVSARCADPSVHPAQDAAPSPDGVLQASAPAAPPPAPVSAEALFGHRH